MKIKGMIVTVLAFYAYCALVLYVLYPILIKHFGA